MNKIILDKESVINLDIKENSICNIGKYYNIKELNVLIEDNVEFIINHYSEVLENDLKINIIQNNNSIFNYNHSFICDDLYAVCGTINFDYRSLIHHYENAIWMYKTSVIKDMKQDFLETLDVSIIQTNETAYQNGITRLFVGILKVFSPFF